jgi:hypothetical protein
VPFLSGERFQIQVDRLTDALDRHFDVGRLGLTAG